MEHSATYGVLPCWRSSAKASRFHRRLLGNVPVVVLLLVAAPSHSLEEASLARDNASKRPVELACVEDPGQPSPFFASSNLHRDGSGVDGNGRSPLRFRVDVQEVLVPVSVTDSTGRFVAGLGDEDFHILDDGVEQRIDLLVNEETPLTLAVVVDVSGSMQSKTKDTARALEELLGALGERDRAFLLGFHWWVVTMQEPTCDHSLLADALSQFEPQGGTALFDGVVEGLYRLYKMGPGTRRALVLLSDGFDNASINTPRETIAAAKATGIPIYTIGLGKKRRQGFFRRLLGDSLDLEFEGLDENHLRALSESTGGHSFIVSDIERGEGRSNALAQAFGRLARELRSHYVLSYQPPRSELHGRWHTIRVELSRPNLFARFRPGYLALPLE